MATIEEPQIENTINSVEVRRMFGHDLQWWNTAMLWCLAAVAVAVAAVAVLVAQAVIIKLQIQCCSSPKHVRNMKGAL